MIYCEMRVSYRVDDSPQGLETSPHREHVLYGVCDRSELQKIMDIKKEKGYKGIMHSILQAHT